LYYLTLADGLIIRPTALFYLTLADGLIIPLLWPTALFYLTLADGLITRPTALVYSVLADGLILLYSGRRPYYPAGRLFSTLFWQTALFWPTTVVFWPVALFHIILVDDLTK
jgi:hypothetical protein